MVDKFYDFCNYDAIFRADVFFVPSNKHIIINPRLPTGIPFDCIDEAYETNEPSIVIPGDISPKELGRWLKWVLRASVQDSKLETGQRYVQYFRDIPGIQELWEEKKRMGIPCIFDSRDPETHQRDFTVIPHRNAIMGWYIHFYLYASEHQFLYVGYLAGMLYGIIDLKNFDPYLPISAHEEAIGGKALEWWRKFQDMEVKFKKMEICKESGEKINIKQAVRRYYKERFGYRFIGNRFFSNQFIRPSPEDIPEFNHSDPLLRHLNPRK